MCELSRCILCIHTERWLSRQRAKTLAIAGTPAIAGKQAMAPQTVVACQPTTEKAISSTYRKTGNSKEASKSWSTNNFMNASNSRNLETAGRLAKVRRQAHLVAMN